jgi:splicing factor 3A subunit 1
MDKVDQGEVEDELAMKDKEAAVAEPKEAVDMGVEPPAAEFIIELPNMSSIDL